MSNIETTANIGSRNSMDEEPNEYLKSIMRQAEENYKKGKDAINI